MQKYLYQDLYELEDKHWWHIGKRLLCLAFIEKYFKGGKILDIGCGTGKNMEVFSKYGETWGIDSSQEALRFCKEFRKLKNVRAGSAENTKFGNSNFDLVVLLDVLEHTDDKKTLIEINRILKKEGLLVISVPAYGWMWSKWDVNLHHRRRYTKPSLAKVLKGAHFQILEISYFNSFLVLPVYIIRKIKTVLAPSEYGSDFRIGSPFVNNILMKLSDLERRLVIKSGIPFGLSIIVVAKKVD